MQSIIMYVEAGVRLGFVLAIVFLVCYKQEKTIRAFLITVGGACLMLSTLWPFAILGMMLEGPHQVLKNLAGKTFARRRMCNK